MDSVAKSPIPLLIFTLSLLEDTQFSTDCVFVFTAFVAVKISSCLEKIFTKFVLLDVLWADKSVSIEATDNLVALEAVNISSCLEKILPKSV